MALSVRTPSCASSFLINLAGWLAGWLGWLAGWLAGLAGWPARIIRRAKGKGGDITPHHPSEKVKGRGGVK